MDSLSHPWPVGESDWVSTVTGVSNGLALGLDTGFRQGNVFFFGLPGN